MPYARDQQVQADASRNRRLDRELSRELGRPDPRAAGVGADLLGRLAQRPSLPAAAERELVARAREGDSEARARLVEAYLPAVAAVAGAYRRPGAIQRVELLQEGVVGLLRALERYEPDRSVPFWGYAVWWVRQAMQQLVAELTRPMVLSDRALRHLARLRDAHREAIGEHGREPGRDELAARSGLPPDLVDDLLAVEGTSRSLDEPVAGDEGRVGTFGELVADPLAEAAYEHVLTAIASEELLALLSGLSDRERAILRARFGLDGAERSRAEIASELGVSGERVRQLERRALGKLAAAAGAEEPSRAGARDGPAAVERA